MNGNIIQLEGMVTQYLFDQDLELKVKQLGFKSVYLSGPMSDLPYLNRGAFAFPHLAFQRLGVKVLTPCNWPLDLQYEDYMKLDFELLLQAEAIFLLNGWYNSRGAKAEFEVAKMISLFILEEKSVCQVSSCHHEYTEGSNICTICGS
jgi:hypothetical protein